MDIEDSVVLVTGANRGLGKAFVAELVSAGAKTVYAGARRVEDVEVTDPRVKPIRVDLVDQASIVAAVDVAGDVTLLVNNAGINTFTPVLGDEARIRQEFDTNVFGTLAVTREFAPTLAANGGGAVVNILSTLSWIVTPDSGGYAASKSALWALTNALRLELREQNTAVVAVHCRAIDTDMASEVPGRRLAPNAVARMALDAVESGDHEVLTDRLTRRVRETLSAPLTSMYPQLGQV
jgi:NAD(P)-dependent dehydrogenase (short-subunit alcohol dehydrogenase family)